MTTTIHVTEVFGFIANVMSNFAFLPQIIKSFRRKRVEDISIGMFAILFATQICWIGYAIPLHATQLWISSAIEIALLLPIFAMWILYRERKRRPKLTIEDASLQTVALLDP
ncbi:MAG: hypothetical protein KDH94_02170 [Coxiellaceae bacterium]|nr:hypothetical protein [Coxiellaceae bacterium]